MFLKDQNNIIFNQNKNEQNKDALKKLVYYCLTGENVNKKAANGVAYFHLNNGANYWKRYPSNNMLVRDMDLKKVDYILGFCEKQFNKKTNNYIF